MKKSLLILCILAGLTNLFGQQTVGLFNIDGNSYEGYSLFAPMRSTTTYLMDHCGRSVHSWTSNYRPSLSSYILKNGNLLRPANAGNSTFNGGGAGGIVEIMDWNGNLIWQYTYSSTTVLQHHDVEYLPNGNVLVIAWEYKDNAQAIAAGRNPSSVGNSLWPDKIIEVEPTGLNTGNIVWEWHAWDHLVQDWDSNQSNFGVVADHPELVNINYTTGPSTAADWLHTNGIDYHEAFDQILISIHNTNEFWVIDHSTSTSEAASHAGGNSGKGGDLLYRWGNPAVYDLGTITDQKLFGQHDARWIPDSLPNAGKIMVYNNGNGRPGGNYSSVDIITPPVDGSGNYSISAGSSFAPANAYFTHDGLPSASWYSQNISGAHPLPNGNILICDGPAGRLFEVDSLGAIHWDYVNPVGQGGAVSQGAVPTQNNVFRVHRYSANYPGFSGHALTAGNPIELNPSVLPPFCTATSIESASLTNVLPYPNPFNNSFALSFEGGGALNVKVHDVMGRLIYVADNVQSGQEIPAEMWAAGLYKIQIGEENILVLKE